MGDVLFKSDDDGEVKVGRKVLQFSDALEKVSLDPASPRNRDEIDRALDTLFELEGFLGSPASDESGNTCGQIIFADPRDDIDALRSGLRTFNSFCGFQLDEDALINGRIYKPTEKEKEEKRQALKDWHEQRSLEREETLRRESRRRGGGKETAEGCPETAGGVPSGAGDAASRG